MDPASAHLYRGELQAGVERAGEGGGRLGHALADGEVVVGRVGIDAVVEEDPALRSGEPVVGLPVYEDDFAELERIRKEPL